MQYAYIINMHQEPQNKMLIQHKNTKVLLVVGRMGHGKSSFLSMLIDERNDQKEMKIFNSTKKKQKELSQSDIKQRHKAQSQILESQKKPRIAAGGKNGTANCSIYPVHQSHKILQNGEQLLVIDTPGIDSRDSACLIVQQIDDLLLQNQGEIVGIAYIIDIDCRQQSQSGHSAFGQFYRLLKLKDKYKRDLIFCVMTKWDDLYDRQETVLECQSKLKQILKEQNCLEAFEKRIKWSSKPNKDFSRYLKKFIKTQQGRDIIKNQWIQLSLTINKQYRDICSFQQYEKNYYQYWNKVLVPLKQLYKSQNKEVGFTKQTFLFPLNINRNRVDRKLKNIVFPIITSGAVNLTRFGFAFLIPSIALTGPIGISIFVSSLAIGSLWTAYQVKKAFDKQFKNSYKKSQAADQARQKNMKLELEKKIQQKICSFLFDELLHKIKGEKNQLEIPFDLYWLNDKIQAFYIGKPEPFATVSKKNPILKYQLKQNETQLQILLKTQIYVPQLYHLDKIIKSVGDECYNTRMFAI